MLVQSHHIWYGVVGSWSTYKDKLHMLLLEKCNEVTTSSSQWALLVDKKPEMVQKSKLNTGAGPHCCCERPQWWQKMHIIPQCCPECHTIWKEAKIMNVLGCSGTSYLPLMLRGSCHRFQGWGHSSANAQRWGNVVTTLSLVRSDTTLLQRYHNVEDEFCCWAHRCTDRHTLD